MYNSVDVSNVALRGHLIKIQDPRVCPTEEILMNSMLVLSTARNAKLDRKYVYHQGLSNRVRFHENDFHFSSNRRTHHTHGHYDTMCVYLVAK
jgi:hypothetical protein